VSLYDGTANTDPLIITATDAHQGMTFYSSASTSMFMQEVAGTFSLTWACTETANTVGHVDGTAHGAAGVAGDVIGHSATAVDAGSVLVSSAASPTANAAAPYIQCPVNVRLVLTTVVDATTWGEDILTIYDGDSIDDTVLLRINKYTLDAAYTTAGTTADVELMHIVTSTTNNVLIQLASEGGGSSYSFSYTCDPNTLSVGTTGSTTNYYAICPHYTDGWCTTSCNHEPAYCPACCTSDINANPAVPHYALTTGTCSSFTGTDSWCTATCNHEPINCPQCCSPDPTAPAYDTTLCVGLASQYTMQCGAAPVGSYVTTAIDDFGCCDVISAMHTNKCLCSAQILARLTDASHTRVLDMDVAANFCAAHGELSVSSTWDVTQTTTFTSCTGVDVTLLDTRLTAFESLKDLFDSTTAAAMQASTLFTTGAMLDWPALGTFTGSTNVKEVLSLWDATAMNGAALITPTATSVQPVVEHAVGDEYYWSGAYMAQVVDDTIVEHDAQMIVEFESGTGLIQKLTIDFDPAFTLRMQHAMSDDVTVATACAGAALGAQACTSTIFQTTGAWDNTLCDAALDGVTTSVACTNAGQNLQGSSTACAGTYGWISHNSAAASVNSVCAPITLNAADANNAHCKESVCAALPAGDEKCIPLYVSFGRECADGVVGAANRIAECCEIISAIMTANCPCQLLAADQAFFAGGADFATQAATTTTVCVAPLSFPYGPTNFNITNTATFRASGNDCTAETPAVDAVFQPRAASLTGILTGLFDSTDPTAFLDASITLAMPGIIPAPVSVDRDHFLAIVEIINGAEPSAADQIAEFNAVSSTVWQMTIDRNLNTFQTQFGLTVGFSSATATTANSLTITFTPTYLNAIAEALIAAPVTAAGTCGTINTLVGASCSASLGSIYSAYTAPTLTEECTKDIETKPMIDTNCAVNHKPFLGDSILCREFWAQVESDTDVADGTACGYIGPAGTCATTTCTTLTTVELH
jgi:hypothetical protein